MKCKNCGHEIVEFKENDRPTLPKNTRIGFYHWFDDEGFFNKYCFECPCHNPKPEQAKIGAGK